MLDRLDNSRADEVGSCGVEAARPPIGRRAGLASIGFVCVEIEQMYRKVARIHPGVPFHEIGIEGHKKIGPRPNMPLAAKIFLLLEQAGADQVEAANPHVGHGRSEERRAGKEGVRTCRSRGSPYHYKTTT